MKLIGYCKQCAYWNDRVVTNMSTGLPSNVSECRSTGARSALNVAYGGAVAPLRYFDTPLYVNAEFGCVHWEDKSK